ncbi:MAG: DUF3096 domain-containing protein [Elusimicrobia bacterium]|nr:DUF3096 domain-containing protein [Elusimicrobiota bacterium]MBD3411722.1 DUF3096 domain-containing protein [Elusimicrobiota bacterium]
MIIGFFFIIAGVLIALFPPLLSFIVSALLILTGIYSIYIGYYLRKSARKFDEPFIDFFFRL